VKSMLAIIEDQIHVLYDAHSVLGLRYPDKV